MYEQHFDLSDRPFRLQPDPDFLYWSGQHRAAARFLAEAAERTPRPGHEVHVLTGEIGGGKTTLVLNFIAKTPPDLLVGLVANIAPDCDDALPWIARSLPPAPGGETAPLSQILARLRVEAAAGRHVAIIIDEAQNLAPAGFATLVVLIEAAAQAGLDNLRMILVGQPELRQNLADARNARFAARIGASLNLSRLPGDETRSYIRHRLDVAAARREIFTDGAMALVHRVAKGIPRLVNLIADQAMLMAFSADQRVVDEALVREAIAQSTAPLLQQLPLPAAPRTSPASAPPSPEPTSRVPPAPGPAIDPVTTPLVEPPVSLQPSPTPPAEPAGQPVPPTRLERLAAPDAPDAAPAATPGAAVVRRSAQTRYQPLQPLPERRRRRTMPLLAGAAVVGALGAAAFLWLGGAPGPLSAPTPAQSPASVQQAARNAPLAAVPALAAAAPHRPTEAQIALARAEVGPDPLARLRAATALAVRDPEAGAIAYMRAALAGSDRAARYLGQITDYGDGVRANATLAARWRMRAGLPGDLPAPSDQRPQVPVPLLAERAPDRQVDLIWTAGTGTESYRIEMRSPAGTLVGSATSDLPALRDRLPSGAAEWRVTTAAAGHPAVTSPWTPLNLD